MAPSYHDGYMVKTATVWQDSFICARRRITIPSRIVKALRLKKGDPMLMRLLGRKLELVPIPRDQLWFWSPEWQKKEREADEDIAQGRFKESTSVDELLKDLKS
jgi:bifunctional DNA-binding transcriptional regulator/antitoxin component of YhaV-PrlF toxin-antitoxin module